MKISIVIASAPDRSTDEILSSLKQIQPKNIEFEILIVKGTHLSVQRNMGIEKATGEYIFLFDDDVIIPDGIIQKVIAIFESEPKIDVIGGPNLTPPTDNFLQHCFGYAHANYFTGLNTSARYYPANIQEADENLLIGCNLAFRSEIIKNNLFDPEMDCNDENEVLNRIIQKGGNLRYSKDFFVYHHRRKTVSAYIKQIFRWGIGRTMHFFKHTKNVSPIFLVPLVFVLYLISLSVYNPGWYLLPALLYIILALSFALQIAIYYKSPFSVFIMPWLFLITHISYGCGLFWGIILKIYQKPRPISERKNFKLTTLSFPTK